MAILPRIPSACLAVCNEIIRLSYTVYFFVTMTRIQAHPSHLSQPLSLRTALAMIPITYRLHKTICCTLWGSISYLFFVCKNLYRTHIAFHHPFRYRNRSGFVYNVQYINRNPVPRGYSSRKETCSFIPLLLHPSPSPEPKSPSGLLTYCMHLNHLLLFGNPCCLSFF